MSPLQRFLSALMVALLIGWLNSSTPRCPREKLGYNCRRGSGYECDCEKEPNK